MNNDINEKIVHAAPVPPFVRFVASAVPMVFDNSLSYYEALCALWKWLQDDVIDVINNNATVTEHYIELDEETRQLFIELKDYVDNYFDNLDVQEEINNKLDDMVEDGTLQEIITTYIQANVAWTFDTVADMKLSENLIAGSYARTLGFYSLADGGGALYYITDSGTANEMDVIAIDTLFANLVDEGDGNIKQYGAVADGVTDNASVIERLITLGKKSIYIPDGTYLVDSVIDLSSSSELRGQSTKDTVILAPNGFLTWNSANKNHKVISNLTIDGDTKTASNIGIEAPFAFCHLSDLIIKNYNIGIKPLTGTWINEFSNIDIEYCNNGIYNADISDVNNNKFTACVLQYIDNEAIHLRGNVNKFDSCNIENAHICFGGRCGRNYEIDNCYLENNNIVFDIYEHSYNSSITVSNSWLMPSTTGLASGWLATIFTASSVDNTTSPLIIEKCHIDNKTKDTIKPFAFHNDGTKTYWGVSLIDNTYTNIKTSSQYNICYDDLFDTTNCPNYACPSNPVTYKTDLPIYSENGIVWYQESQGNMLGYGRTNNKIKMVGKYAVEQTTGSVTISPTKKYGCYYPTVTNLPVTVRFSDATLGIALMNIALDNISVTNIPYNSKTTAEIIFNNEYGGILV